VNLPAGLAVALGIRVLLPLAAVAVGRRWRDPPRERWGISPERLAAAANTPELAAAAEPGGGGGGGERCGLMGRRAHCPVLTPVGHFEGSYVLTPGGAR
jgi:hypothetical protein